MSAPKISDLKTKLMMLEWIDNDPRVRAAKELVRAEREPEIAKIKEQIEALRGKRPQKAPRWPENTPENVLARAKEYWAGTTELATFRVHLWNDKALWTSYPSGGYSDNGGWHPTSAQYYLISMTKSDQWGRKPAHLGEWDVGKQGRFPKAKMQEMLDQVT